MKRYYLLLLCQLYCFISFTQPAASTLQKKIKQDAPLLFNNTDSGLVVVNTWIAEANSKKDILAYVQAQVVISQLLAHQSKKDAAEKLLGQALQFAESKQNDAGIQYILMAEANYFLAINMPAKVSKNHQTILELEKRNHLPLLAVDYNLYLANYYDKKTDSSLFYLQKALYNAKQQQDFDKIASIYWRIGNTLCKKNAAYENAKNYLDSSALISRKQGYLRTLGLALQDMASCYHKQNNYGTALQIIKECRDIQKLISDPSIITTINLQANIFIPLGRVNDALQYYKEAIDLCYQYNNHKKTPSIYQNIGSAYSQLKIIDSSKLYFQKAIQMASSLNDGHAFAYATYNNADLLKNEGDYKGAKNGMLTALRKFEEIQENSNVAWVLPRIVELELGQLESNKPDKSIYNAEKLKAMLDRSVALNANGNNYETLENIYTCYARLGKLTGNTILTTTYLEKLLVIKDSIFNQAKLKSNIEMAAKLKEAEQKTTIAELETKNTKSSNQKNVILLLLIFTIISTIILYFNYRYRVRKRHELNLIKQKEGFRNQVSSDLHDDVGTLLTGVAMQAEVASTQANENQKTSFLEISNMSREAMEQMRDIVWALDSRKDKYENLVDRMRAFAERNLALKNITHQFTFTNADTKKFIDPKERQAIYLIFKEAITNIIKHSNCNNVHIHFSFGKSRTELSIKDNGMQPPGSCSDGLGMSNMKMRAKKIGGTLTTKFDDGFVVEMVI